MRPPYLSTNDLALSTLAGLGYKIIEVDIDTQDWAEGPAGEIDLSIQWYEGNQTAGGTISLNHDPYQPTAEQFIPAIITYLAGLNLKSVPVGECLGDDPANWYRGGSPVSSSSISSGPSATASGSASGSATAPAGNGTWTSSPSGGNGGSWSRPAGQWPSGSKPTATWTPPAWSGPKAPHGGDTEPGHGPNAGRGSLPGHKGEGNDGCNSTGPGSPGWTGAPGAAPTWGAGGNSPSWSQSHNGSNASPTYYSNSATSLTGSVLVLGVAALALFL